MRINHDGKNVLFIPQLKYPHAVVFYKYADTIAATQFFVTVYKKAAYTVLVFSTTGDSNALSRTRPELAARPH